MGKYITKVWAENHTHEAKPDTIYNKHLDYKTDGFFVEIGMGGTIPPSATNTGDVFADIGWSGAYFEALKANCEEGYIRHKDNLSHIKIFKYAVGDIPGTLHMYPGDTLVPDLSQYYDSIGWLPEDYKKDYGEHSVEIITPEQAMIMADCPSKYDVLSIDVEGYELKIIKNYDFNRWRPEIVIIELRVNNHSFQEKHKQEGREVIQIMLDNGYEIIHHDVANFWFKDVRS